MLLKLAKFLVSTVVLPLSVYASLDVTDSKSKMFSQLDTLNQIFSIYYAPQEWKSSSSNWDLNLETQKAKRDLMAFKSDGDALYDKYHNTLLKWFNSMHDQHVSVAFYRTATSILPFRLAKVGSKYLVVATVPFIEEEIDDAELLEIIDIYRYLKKGDEILSINGKPIHHVVEKFKKDHHIDASETSQRFAEMDFTFRSAARGSETPKGTLKIKVKHQNGETKEYQTLWLHSPEELAPPKSLSLDIAKTKTFLDRYPSLQKQMTLPSYTARVQDQKRFKKLLAANSFKTLTSYSENEDDEEDGDESDLMPLGAKYSGLPALGKIILDNPTQSRSFAAYLFEAPNGKTGGYLRIPSYVPTMGSGEEELKELISVFQSRADFLVVDQMNNPGGAVVYLYGILSMLTDRPLEVPQHRMAITQVEVLEMMSMLEDIQQELEDCSSEEEFLEEMGQNLAGYVVDMEFYRDLVNYSQFVIQQWEEGKTMTDLAPLYGVKYIKPHPEVRFTKPILVLANEWSISCADFFPAIMQDNQRAKIFGAKTSGAGGYVFGSNLPNNLGLMMFSYTASIAERLNGQPIEDLGVTPDFPYTITENDIQNQYQDCTQAILKAIENL